MNAQIATTRPSRIGSSSKVRATDVPRTPAIPASQSSASTGSCRARAASSLSSRSAEKTARGAWSTSRVRSSQSRSADCGCACELTCPGYSEPRDRDRLVHAPNGEREAHVRFLAAGADVEIGEHDFDEVRVARDDEDDPDVAEAAAARGQQLVDERARALEHR